MQKCWKPGKNAVVRMFDQWAQLRDVDGGLWSLVGFYVNEQ